MKEDIKSGHDFCFFIGEKMFFVTGMEGEFGVSFKVNDEEFKELSARDRISHTPYLTRNKWVFVNDPKCFLIKDRENYLRQSYDLLKSKLKKKKIISLKNCKEKTELNFQYLAYCYKKENGCDRMIATLLIYFI